MKKILLLSGLILSMSTLFAQQRAEKISPAKGLKIKMSSKDTSNNTQKRGEESMEMKSISESVSEIVILEPQEKGYLATVTIKSMKLDFDGYGQKVSYNSADPAKQDGMIAEQMKNLIGNVDTVTLNFEGRKEEEKEEKKGKGKGRGGMMKMMNQGGANIENAFLIVPAEAKEGSGWKKDQTKEDVRSQTIYFVEKIDGKMATVSFKKKTKGTITRGGGGGGMGEMKIELDNLSSGLITVDLTTGLVKTFYESVNSNSKTNMGGQDMPSTGTTSSAVVFE